MNECTNGQASSGRMERSGERAVPEQSEIPLTRREGLLLLSRKEAGSEKGRGVVSSPKGHDNLDVAAWEEASSTRGDVPSLEPVLIHLSDQLDHVALLKVEFSLVLCIEVEESLRGSLGCDSCGSGRGLRRLGWGHLGCSGSPAGCSSAPIRGVRGRSIEARVHPIGGRRSKQGRSHVQDGLRDVVRTRFAARLLDSALQLRLQHLEYLAGLSMEVQLGIHEGRQLRDLLDIIGEDVEDGHLCQFLRLFQFLLCLDQLVVWNLLPLLAIVVKSASLQLRSVVLDILQFVVLHVRQRIDEVTLDGVLHLVLDICTLPIRLARVHQRLAQIAVLSQFLPVVAHSLSQHPLRLRVRRSLRRPTHLQYRSHRRHLGARCWIRLQVLAHSCDHVRDQLVRHVNFPLHLVVLVIQLRRLCRAHRLTQVLIGLVELLAEAGERHGCWLGELVGAAAEKRAGRELTCKNEGLLVLLGCPD
ncbi:hypothetical protein PMAYCL1PPCAC_24461, partial [Pristionchus mayeri]